MMKPAAHLGQKAPHDLKSHLTKVASAAKRNASAFNCGNLAALIGLWHDLGKYNPDWQEYLRQAATTPEDAHQEQEKMRGRGPNHSSAGALYALQWLHERLPSKESADRLARILAYPIMGHHTGLADFDGGNSSLYKRLHNDDTDHLQKALYGLPPQDVLHPDAPEWKALFSCLHNKDISFLIRMLFSCLVDADFLDTESYMSPEKSGQRQRYPEIQALQASAQDYLNQMEQHAPATSINTARAEILESCRQAATQPPGFFSLTVPTGGGKTLSSLAFALEHAQHHGKRRIIYAIPYTSIIEQTANVFRKVFHEYDNPLVEHHSSVSEGGSGNEKTRQRLASENWDAPLIVTTTVQLFESLYANRPGRCRKLHNTANSIIILDEAHLIPPDLRWPVLHALHQLVTHYGATVVLCTATPTGIENLKKEKKYIPALHPIIKNALPLYDRFRRVHVDLRLKDEDIVHDWNTLAKELAKHKQVLCIVNRRDDCRDLHAAMPADSIHLSALMCAEHRSAIIDEIKQKLQDGKPARVISTQLVEAGVDIDFPVVYRAMAGLDSIAQAAGRCNREGKLEKGHLIVFRPARGAPQGILKQAEQAAAEVMRKNPHADILSPEMQAHYFKILYGRLENGDRHNILDAHLKANNDFAYQFDAASAFRIVDDSYRPVVVRYNNDNLLVSLYHGKPEKWLLREAQRYTVSIPQHMLDQLLRLKAIKEIIPGLFVQDIAQAPRLYQTTLGLMAEHHNDYPSDDLVV